MANQIRVGNITPGSLVIGTDVVAEIYMGTTQVFP